MPRLHAILAVLVPALGLAPSAALLGRFAAAAGLSSASPARVLALLFCLSAASGGTAVLAGRLLREERAAWTSRLRATALFVLAVYGIASLTVDRPMGERFLPNFGNLWPALYAAAQWLYSLHIQGALRDRELYLREIEGKRGEALRIAFRDMGTLAEDARRGMERVSLTAAAFSLITMILLLSAAVLGLEIPGTTAAAAWTGMLLHPLVRAAAAHYDFEQYAAGAGLVMEDGLPGKRLSAALLGTACIGAACILPALRGPLLDFGSLLAFFERLFSGLFRGAEGSPLPLPDPQPAGDPYAALRRLAEDSPGGLDLSGLFEFISRTAPYLAAAAVLAFLSAPLFSRDFRRALRRRSVRAYLAGKWAALRELFRRRDRRPAGKVEVGRMETEELEKRLERLMEGRRNRGNRREIGRIVRGFMALIAWGTERGLAYAPSTAPGDYARALAASFPEAGQDALFLGAAFEEAVYSPRPPSRDRLREYEARLRRITGNLPAGGKIRPGP